jgi:antitoxin MazE
MAIDGQVAKWGNSLAVRLPKAVAQQAGLAEGDRLSVSVARDGSVVLRGAGRKYSLEELVSRITPANRHKESDWGRAAGREAW